MNDEVKQTFTLGLMVSYNRSSIKLSNHLVTVKLYPIDRIIRSKGGKRRSEVCGMWNRYFLAQLLEKHLKWIISLVVTRNV